MHELVKMPELWIASAGGALLVICLFKLKQYLRRLAVKKFCKRRIMKND